MPINDGWPLNNGSNSISQTGPSRTAEQYNGSGFELTFSITFLLFSDPELIVKALGIVYRAFSIHLVKRTEFRKATTQIGALTLIQRFGSALNFNVHFHILFRDGVMPKVPRVECDFTG